MTARTFLKITYAAFACLLMHAFAAAPVLAQSTAMPIASSSIQPSPGLPAYGTLTPRQMQADLAILKRALVEIHPGLYRYSTPEQIDRRFAAADAQASRPESESAFFLSLAQLVGTIKCGHTYLNPYNQRDSLMQALFGGRTYFPVFFSVINRRFIVTENVSGQSLPPGSEITAINGIPVSKIIAALLTVTTADGTGTLGHRLYSLGLTYGNGEKYPLFDLYFPLFFPLQSDQFQVNAVDAATRKPIILTVPALTEPERATALTARYGAAPQDDALWSYSQLSTGTAYLKLGSFVTFHQGERDYKAFLAEAFAHFRAANDKYLIVDLRGNSGGDEQMGETLAGYLARLPIASYDPKVRFVRAYKIDDDLGPDLDTYDDTLRQTVQVSLNPAKFKPMPGGLYQELNREPDKTVVPAADHFPGRAFILADAANASAAFQFLRAVKANHLATIVGQPGGGSLQGINGDSFFFLSLPNSHIEIDLPVYYEAPPTPQPDQPVQPDIAVATTTPDLPKYHDADLGMVQSLIAKQHL